MRDGMARIMDEERRFANRKMRHRSWRLRLETRGPFVSSNAHPLASSL
jgi:hypothetical protein